jgi:integrase
MLRPNRGPYLKFNSERGRYYIQWSEVGIVRKRSTGTSDRQEAQIILASFIQQLQIHQQPNRPLDPSEYLISDALALYGELHAPTTKAPDRIAYAIEPLLDFWERNTVGDITKQTCRAYLKARGRSDGTMRRELGVLKAALNFAYSEGRITRVPYVMLPEKPQGKDRWLNRDEAAALLNAARTARGDVRLYLPLFILLGLYTGARKGALLSLRWHQIDFDNGMIDFFPVGEQQSNKRKSKIPIPDRLMTFLKLARRRGSDIGYVLNRDGTKLADVKHSFGNACAKAGIFDTTPHTLRHTCGTWMAQRGVPLFQIGGWLGHSNERTVELYAHHHPDFLVEAKRAMDRR